MTYSGHVKNGAVVLHRPAALPEGTQVEVSLADITAPSESGRPKTYQFTVVYERDDDGRVLALCPALQGCYAEGESEEEARANIREAIQAHIESRLAHGNPIHAEIGIEEISVTL